MVIKDYSSFSNIKLEDTGLFNYKGGQSSVYNRLRDNNITTLQELFEADDLNRIEYRNDKVGQNFYIHSELKGIIRLLRYKYLNEYSYDLITLLDYKPVNVFAIRLNQVDYGYPGYIFNQCIRSKSKISSIFDFYRVLKQCGFDQSGVKAVLDLIYLKNSHEVSLCTFCKIDIEAETLVELLSQIPLEKIKKVFSKVPNEYVVFINVLTLLLDCYKNYELQEEIGKSI